jgi:predicted NBD/HSP70 family sugar kinase
LRRAGSASRAQLARNSGLSKPTVSQALANLERAGLVREIGLQTPPRGRAAVVYEPNGKAGYVVGIDIGRSFIRVAAADLSGEIVARLDVPNRARSAASVVQAAAEVAHEVIADAGLTWQQVIHTVVGSPGIFDPASGRLQLAPNLPGWTRRGLVDALHDALDSSLAIDNDVNLAALGERAFGVGTDARSFVYVSVGTGVGMGIVIDGALYRGAHGVAGEIGYLPFPSGGAPSARARDRGLFEEAASATAVVATARELGMPGPLSAKRIFAAARAEDPIARAAVEREAQRLAIVVATVAAVVDPELVVLGGGVGANIDLLLAPLERELERITPLHPRVVESALGQDAIVLGAIATAVDAARDLVFERR